MKKLIVSMLIVLAGIGTGIAQKYAYVDTEYILDNIPEYRDAIDLLDEFSTKWQKETEAKFAEIDKLYREYQAESVLLPEDIKRQRQEEIITRERQAKDFQKSKFGPEGELFVKRQELVEPIQEKVYNAISKIALDFNYAFVFDKAGSLSILYSDPKLDISDDVLDEVGNVMQTVRREERKKSSPKN